jgi:predicted O-methyltransferase YrrM
MNFANKKQKEWKIMKAARQGKWIVLPTAFFLIAALGVFFFSGVADAAEAKMVGTITRIEMAGENARTATVILKDNDSQKEVVLIVNDEETLDKLKDHRIGEGDEIRCKYKTEGGQNTVTYFRKTAGC